MARFIALLRGINVGGRARVPMAELRELVGELGWRKVETYIQSGNLVFEAAGKAAALEDALEGVLEKRFGFSPAVIVRPAAAWKAHADSNPFPEASAAEPNRVLLALAKTAPRPGAAREIQARAAAGERVEQAGDALWFHYPAGVGTSKLSPALIDRLAGSPVTARNWRTVQKLQEMAAA
jgi:uncharacterized protein (DUF1697 family)